MDEKCTMLLFLRSVGGLLPRLTGLVIVSVLTAAILSPVLAADAAILSTVAETTISVKEACDGPVIDPDVVVKDQAGNIITETTVGTQVSIEGSVTMDCFQYADDSQTIIFEVRYEQDITTYLAWQMLSEDSGGQITAGVSWTPDKPGKYEVRFFPIVCLSCPMVLSNVVTYEITVV